MVAGRLSFEVRAGKGEGEAPEGMNRVVQSQRSAQAYRPSLPGALQETRAEDSTRGSIGEGMTAGALERKARRV